MVWTKESRYDYQGGQSLVKCVYKFLEFGLDSEGLRDWGLSPLPHVTDLGNYTEPEIMVCTWLG